MNLQLQPANDALEGDDGPQLCWHGWANSAIAVEVYTSNIFVVNGEDCATLAAWMRPAFSAVAGIDFLSDPPTVAPVTGTGCRIGDDLASLLLPHNRHYTFAGLQRLAKLCRALPAPDRNSPRWPQMRALLVAAIAYSLGTHPAMLRDVEHYLAGVERS